MKAVAVYFIKVTAISFVSIVMLAVLIGMAFSAYSQATDVRVSEGAYMLLGEDYFWLAAISAAIGAVAVIVRLIRRGLS